MAQKVKVSREFTFKAYKLAVKDEKNTDLVFVADQHVGEFYSKSDCHYYCEKDVLDFVKMNAASLEGEWQYGIYKVSTIEDSKIADQLVEIITVENGEIHIR